MQLKEKVVILTGATNVIGRAIAKKFLDNGANIVLVDENPSELYALSKKIDKDGFKTLSITCRNNDEKECRSLILDAVKKFKKIDILVNNFIKDSDEYLLDLSEADWHNLFSFNLTACLNFVKTVKQYMIEQKNGKIIIFDHSNTAYSSMKQNHWLTIGESIRGLTKSLALEFGPYNVNVNCIAPDFVETERIRNIARQEGMFYDEWKKLAIALVPLRRIGTPEDVSELALFLASEMSTFITGQIIHIRGGP